MWPDIVSAPAPPVTPERRAPQENTFHSTPINCGTAYYSEFANVHTQVAYEPYIKEDLRQEKQVPYNVFQLSLFGEYQGMVVNNDDIVSVSREAKYRKLVRDFGKPVTDETYRYEPFINLVNHVLDRMRELDRRPRTDLGVVACRNDPTIIRGSDAARKPDIVLANRDQVKRPRLGVDRTSKEGREKHPFQWSHLMCFFEHKHSKTALHSQFTSTSDERIRVGTSILGNLPPPPTTLRNRVLRSSVSGTSSHPASRSLPSTSTSSRKRSATSQEPTGSISRSKRIKTTSEKKDAEERPKGSKRHGEDARVQCGSYALEMISNGSIRSHAVGAQVIDGRVKFTYYTHSAIITCEPINFMQEHQKFLRMMQGFASLSKQEWGVEPRFESPAIPASRVSLGRKLDSQFTGFKLTLNTGDTLTLGDTLYRQHGLIGRATCVVKIESGKNPKAKKKGTKVELGKTQVEERIDWTERLKNGGVIVKTSWPAKSRTPERKFLRHVRSIVDKDFEEQKWVLQHLPELIHAEEVEVDVVQRRFKYYVDCTFKGFDFELRELRISVQEQLLPIIKLQTAETVLTAWQGIVTCYEWLHDVAKIMHRDISINNFMYRLDKDGKVVGVLIDFDLAAYTYGDRTTLQHRTGTKPFLAIDLLLEGPEHKYRFDLESCFYVMCWQVHRYHNGEEVLEKCLVPGGNIELQPVYQDWVTSTNKDLANMKMRYIHEVLDEPTEHFRTLDGHLSDIRMAFSDGLHARSRSQEMYKRAVQRNLEPPEFDDDTLGGYVTIKIIKDILNKPLP